MLQIKGLQKLTLIDFPGRMAAIIFLPGCNFRCPYCQNPDLILNPEGLPTIDQEEVMALLRERRGWLDGVCITGGEPTIWSELPELIKAIKGLGYEIKLDTNGSNPDMLEALVRERLVDYIAMDIKAPLEKYEMVAKTRVDKEAIQRSVNIIKSSGLSYEFRTTILPALLSEQDVLAIGRWLNGAERFCLQQFRSIKTLDPTFQSERSYSRIELERLASLLKPYFKHIEIRV